MKRRVSYVLVAGCIWSVAGAATAGQWPALKVAATDHGLVATAADGAVAWRVRTPAPVVLEPTGDGSAVQLDNGYVIDALGRVLYRQHDTAGGLVPRNGPRGGGCPYWSTLAEVAPPTSGSQSNSHTVPLFDSQGNAWVFNTFIDTSGYSLQVRRSDGHAGTWGPLETISDTTNYVSGAQATMDAADNITVVFRDIAANYDLYAMRYEPGSGWSGPDRIYSSAVFFQAIRVAADAQGNVVVVFDPWPGGATTLWTIVYDAASGTWGSASQVTPAGYDVILPTLTRNATGDAIYLTYLVLAGGSPGLYLHRFDSASLSWGPAQMLPGTGSASYSIAAADSQFPATVNAAGELTLFWQSEYPYAVYASRCDGGMLQSAHLLLPPGPDQADMENFTHAASTEFGDALGVLTRYEGDAAIHFYAFRYRAGVGWDAAENPYTFTYNGTTRSRIAPYRGDYCMATFLAPQDGTVQITARRYERSAWLGEVVDIPQSWESYFPEVGCDSGEALLVFEAEELFGANFGIWGTWLRNLPGDLTDDGSVDLNDLAVLLAAYNRDQGGDVDGDGDSDLADLALLLANYGGTCP